MDIYVCVCSEIKGSVCYHKLCDEVVAVQAEPCSKSWKKGWGKRRDERALPLKYAAVCVREYQRKLVVLIAIRQSRELPDDGEAEGQNPLALYHSIRAQRKGKEGINPSLSTNDHYICSRGNRRKPHQEPCASCRTAPCCSGRSGGSRHSEGYDSSPRPDTAGNKRWVG